MPWEAGGVELPCPASPPPSYVPWDVAVLPIPTCIFKHLLKHGWGDCVVFVSGQRGSQAILCYNLSKVDATPPPPLTGRRGMRHRGRLDVRERRPNYPYLTLHVYQLMGTRGEGWLVGWLCLTWGGGPCCCWFWCKWGLKENKWKGYFLDWFVWLSRAGTIDFCSALAALVGPQQYMFFLTVHYFNFFVSIAQQAGQAAVLGRLSLGMCLCAWQYCRASLLCVHYSLKGISS